MDARIVLTFAIVLCAVIIETKCDMNSEKCKVPLPPYTRIKRAKYYSNPPSRFYRRPPMPYPVKGAFSFTPPPNYMMDNGPPYPAYGPNKVSGRPTNAGLGDEDINNLVKYLSKSDLDKIMKYAGEKHRHTDKYNKGNTQFQDELTMANNGGFNKVSKRLEGNSYKLLWQNTADNQKYIQKRPHPRHKYEQNLKDDQESDSDINYMQDSSERKVVYLRPQKPSSAPNHYLKITENDVYPTTSQRNGYNDNYSLSKPYVSEEQTNKVFKSVKAPFLGNKQEESFKYDYTSTHDNSFDKDPSESKQQYSNEQESSNNPMNDIRSVENYAYSSILQDNHDEQKYMPYSNENHEDEDYSTEYSKPNYISTEPKTVYSIRETTKFPGDNTNVYYVKSTADSNIPYTNEESSSEANDQMTYSDTTGDGAERNFEFSYLNDQGYLKDGNIFTDSSMMKEEYLPKPINLREEDEEGSEDPVTSFTNNVQSVVKGDTNSYNVESFGELPLMNYHNSKLHTVSSYNVPHYTITSSSKHQSPPKALPPTPQSPSDYNDPALELAPKDADGHEQSDAHLKATRIWTHRSKGTAYTLHKDGTLSLETPKFKQPYGER